MRWISALSVVLCLVGSASAAGLTHVYEDVRTGNGEAVVGASVYVYTAGTTSGVSIYEDASGDSLITQPTSTSAAGNMDFYVPPGIYNFRIVKTSLSIDQTWAYYPVGGFSVDGELIATGKTQLGDAPADTVDTYGNVRWRADLYSDFDSSVLWFYKTEGTRRLGSERDRVVGFGPRSIQIEEDGALTAAVAYPQATGGAFLRYDDIDLVSLYPYTGNESYVYNTWYASNRRDSLHQWMWEGVYGAYDDTVGVAPVGMWYETNIPDSNGTGGQRVAYRFEWSALGTHTQIANGNSSLAQFYEDGATGVAHYDFRRDELRLNPEAGGTQKGITILSDTSQKFTKLTNNGTTSTQIWLNNGEGDFIASDGTNTGRLDSYTAIFDVLQLERRDLGSDGWPSGYGPGWVVFSTGDTFYVCTADTTWGGVAIP